MPCLVGPSHTFFPIRAAGISHDALILVCAYLVASTFEVTASAALPLFGVLAAFVVVRSERIHRSNPLVLPIALFLGSTALSIALSEEPSRSARLSISFVPAVLAFLLVSERFDSRQVRTLYAVFSAVALVAALMLLREVVRQPDATPSQWIEAAHCPLLVVSNDVLFFVVIAPLCISLLDGQSGKGVTALALASLALSMAMPIIFQSRGAVLASVVVLVASFGLSQVPRRGMLGLIAAFIALAVALDAASGFRLLARFSETWMTRIPMWLAAVAMFRDAPVFGNGTREFGDLLPDYFWVPAWATSDYRYAAWAHNVYLELLAEQGVVGLAAFAFLLHRFFRRGLSLREEPDVRSLATGGVVAMGVIGFGGLFEVSLVRMWVVLVVFFLAGCMAGLGRPEER